MADEKTLEQIKEELDAWLAKYIRQTVNFRTGQSLSVERFNELFNLLIEQGDDNISTMEVIIEYLNLMVEDYTGLLSDLTDELDATYAQIQADNVALLAEVDGDISDLRSTLDATYAQIQTNNATLKKDINTEITNLRSTLDTTYAQIQTDNTALSSEVNTKVSGLRNELNTTYAQIQTDNAALLADVASQINAMDIRLMDVYTQIQTDNAALLVVVRDEIATLANRIDGYQEEVLALVQVQVDDIATIAAEVEASKQYVADLIASSEDVLGDAAELFQEMDAINARLDVIESSALSPINTVEGSVLIIPDTYDGGVRLELQGKAVQDGTPTPDAPVEIQSVGVLNSTTGKYDIEVISCGKNIFDDSIARPANLCTYDASTRTYSSTNGISWSNVIPYTVLKLKPNETYTLKMKYSQNGTLSTLALYVMDLYDFSKSLANMTVTQQSGYMQVTFTAPSHGYVQFRFHNNATANAVTDINNSLSEIQLELGSTATAYEPYKGNKITLALGEPLRGIGSVTDRLIKKDGVWGVERNFAGVVFDGSTDEGWSLQSINENNFANFLIYLTPLAKNVPTGTKSNMFTYDPTLISSVVREGITIANGTTLYIRVASSRCSDVASFKTWLQSNPVTVVYPLVTPTWTPLSAYYQRTLNKYLNTYDGVTNIYTADPLGPNLVVAYGVNNASALSIRNENDVDMLSPIENNITLVASKWVGATAPYLYELGFSGDYDVELLTTLSTTLTQVKALEKAKIISNATDNTVIAWGTKPTIDIPLMARVKPKKV